MEFTVTREQIIHRFPLLAYLEARGVELKRSGSQYVCRCPLHEDNSPSFSVSEEKGTWHCFGGCGGGSVIDLHAKLNGFSIGEAMRDLCPESGSETRSAVSVLTGNKKPMAAIPRPENGAPQVKPKAVCAYDYHDASGRLVYQVIRYEPKTFRQRAVNPDGSFNWSMDGVERVLYKLPEILSSSVPYIFIVEGEKDADTLWSVGIPATCNAGGAKKWLPSYSQALKGRKVYLIPDNDEPGQEHSKTVLKSLEGIVQWAKWIDLPKENEGKAIKDVTDFRNSFDTQDEFFQAMMALEKKGRLIDRGVDVELYTMAEMEQRYKNELIEYSDITLDLKNWLPELELRPMIPGDLLGIVAGTGQCKTAATQNLIGANPSLSTVYFQMELPETLMFERSAAIACGMDAEEVHAKYRKGEAVGWQRWGKFNNLLVCPKSGLTLAEIDELIARSSAKFGKVPNCFIIDYVQLVRGKGSRYDRVSDACEGARVLAKKWGCIGIIISQISRKKNEREKEGDTPQPLEVGLSDAKESGSFENSCSVVLGIWKTAKTEMKARILKTTKGGTAGQTVGMILKGGSFVIQQKY